MSFTFISATYGNAERTAAVAITKEAGAVALSAVDRPKEWAALHASGLAIADCAEPAAPVPLSISDRQFAAQLKVEGILTHAEAMAFVQSGTIPGTMQTLIEGLPTLADRERAELLIAGATNYERDHELTAVFASAWGWDANRTDEFFRHAAEL